jgi:hypothetical protein
MPEIQRIREAGEKIPLTGGDKTFFAQAEAGKNSVDCSTTGH